MLDEKEKEGNGEYKPEYDIVEEGAKNEDQPQQDSDKGQKEAKPGYGSDERLSASQREEEPDDVDDDVEEPAKDGAKLTDAEIEARREKRRRERRARAARQNAARERDAREMHFLRIRNEQLERAVGSIAQRQNQTEIQQVEGRLETLRIALGEAEQVLAQAHEANNGADIVKLNRTIRELEAGIGRLNSYKAGLAKERAAEDKDDTDKEDQPKQGAREAPRPPQSVIKNLSVFSSRHPWFKPDGNDEDSRVVQALDAAVLAEGYDPANKDYWLELEDRMTRRLPERMQKYAAQDSQEESEQGDPSPKNGNGQSSSKSRGPRMSAGSQNRGSGQKFMLSAERKQAMIEAGVWDDPELRDKQIRAYAQWDKENQTASR